MTMPASPDDGVVSDLIHAMKNNPSCLAAILLAALFAVLTYFALQADADRRAKIIELMLTRCFDQVQGLEP